MICTRATTESSSGVTTSTVASQTGSVTGFPGFVGVFLFSTHLNYGS